MAILPQTLDEPILTGAVLIPTSSDKHHVFHQGFLGAIGDFWQWECDREGHLTEAHADRNPKLQLLLNPLIGKSLNDIADAEQSRYLDFADPNVVKVDCVVQLSASFGGSKWARLIGAREETEARGPFRGAAFDVTQEMQRATWFKVTEEALAEGSRRQRAIFDGTFGLILVLTSDGLVLEVNQAICDLFGVLREQMVGLTLSETPLAHDNGEFTSAMAEHVSRANETPLARDEATVVIHDGSSIILDISLKTVQGDVGHENFIILEARDITESKALQEHALTLERDLQQSRKMDSLGTLAGGIAHEINTPIQYIGDNLTFLKDAQTVLLPLAQRALKDIPDGSDIDLADAEFLMQELPDAIDQAAEGVRRVAGIVRAVKAFSYPDSGDKEPIDIDELIHSSITITQNEWKFAAKVDFERCTDPSARGLPCNASELGQVMVNLIVNATHAVQERWGRKFGEIKIHSFHEAGVHVITVTDNGAGIPASIQERVFDPFFTTKDPGKGTGQGLAIAHQAITKSHGGRIQVESIEGEGTTFRIELPIA